MTDPQAQASISQAIQFLQVGQPEKAKNILLAHLRRLDRDAQVHFLLGVTCQMLGDPDAALSSYDRSIALNRNIAEPYFNRGLLLHALGRYAEAIVSLKNAVRLGPASPERFYSLGLAQYYARAYGDAVVSLKKAIQLKPNYVEAYTNCGNALFGLEKFDEALDCYDRALAIRRDVADIHFNRGNTLRELGRAQEAIDSFEAAIAVHPNYPEAYINRGVVLTDLRRFDLAIESHKTAIQLRPDLAEAHVNLGATYASQRQFDKALSCFAAGLQIKPNMAEVLLNAGDAYQQLGQYDLAQQSYVKALEVDPNLPTGLGMLAHTKSFLCDWADYESLLSRIKDGLSRGLRVCTPFAALSLDVGHNVQIQSAALAFNVSRKRPSRVVPVHSFKRPKIRLGYFSADFYRHAAMNLMAELFELHDRSMFELVAVSYGFPHEDDVRARVKKAFDQFIEAKDMSDGDVAQRSRESEIDIAIDLTGHTAHSRVGIFARGVAPLQTQYLGFPGSMGSSVYDYVIGDRIVIPEREIQNYPEKIIFMPDCFQVNDRSRVVAAPKNRTEYGLPDEGFIFASFNQSHKFNPPRFKLWMSILRQVPGSVLWLVSTHPLQIANLRAFAGECGVDPNRIIFASQIAYADHLARYQIVDLALDTLPFNGGATTSDALWAGAPVLTQVGDSYAGRMTASLLTAAGLPELVTESPAAYERLAVELALERQKLKLMRQTLAANRLTCSLFDSRRFTRHLEIAYQQIWQRHKSGQTPDHIYVSAVP